MISFFDLSDVSMDSDTSKELKKSKDYVKSQKILNKAEICSMHGMNFTVKHTTTIPRNILLK